MIRYFYKIDAAALEDEKYSELWNELVWVRKFIGGFKQ